MNRIYPLLFISLLFLASCGGSEQDQLEAKQKELADLQTQRADIDGKIAALEAEIALLDTTLAKGSGAVPVNVMAVEPDTFQHYIKVQGHVETENNILVSPKTGGTYTSVFVKEGQAVRKGQELARVDDAVLTQSLEELRVQLSLATSLYDKQQKLWDQKIGSEVQLLQAKAQKEALEKRIATTKEQIGLSVVYAPIAGIVEEVMAQPGAGAVPGMPAFRVVSLSDLTFRAHLSESYIPFVKKGDEVTISFPSINQKMSGTISTISQTINPSNRTVEISVALPQSPDIKANMVGEISINDVSHLNSIMVPKEYVQKGVTGSFVVVAERDSTGEGYQAVRIPVTVGMEYENLVEVEGLKRGHLVVTEGFQGLGRGEAVTFSGVQNQK